MSKEVFKDALKTKRQIRAEALVAPVAAVVAEVSKVIPMPEVKKKVSKKKVMKPSE